eukprot:TRINITY_DN8261_c0_g1_i2.p1 TRINITY_DN8261_c0_g1~~TRINITY_DN8261_c0_g1_i2.p1  ORF type:complete len:380 (+),score=64.23 TRINITY_DN8261_c0_g1_i2:1219-2358(+)
MKQYLNWLDNNPIIERYSWFGTRIYPDTGVGQSSSLFKVNALGLSPIGEYYTAKTCTPSATVAPPAQAYIQLKNGKYVTVSSQTPGLLTATATSTATATLFKFAAVSGGYSIQSTKTTSNNFVAADNYGNDPLVANRASAGGWETFLFRRSNGFWTIAPTVNNLLVGLRSADSALVATGAPSACAYPDLQLFNLVVPGAAAAATTTATTAAAVTTAAAGTTTTTGAASTTTSTTTGATCPSRTTTAPLSQGYIQSQSNRKYVVVQQDKTLAATASATSSATLFRFAAVTGGGYSIRSATSNQYVCADNNGANPLIANRGSASGWETFTFSKPTTSSSNVDWTFTAVNNLAVSLQSNNQLRATGSLTTCPSTQLWTLVAA